ncbi:MAG: NAD-dependent epimerase/dehydratase family protein [Candidatus Hydrogenedentes bacterium]|nr:NAD-dependent epimerase/dehydratase family protein [Candidatus Hydrogenedentota bacterium]
MKAVVTGGAGFIGSHVVDTLIEHGHDVAVVDNLVTGRKENLNARARFHQVDICDAALQEVFAQERPDAVFHLAAQMDVTKSVSDPGFDAKVNVLGLIQVLNLCKEFGTKRIIFSSTGGAIYGAAKDYPATELTRPEPLSPYAVSKFAGEEYIKMYGRVHGLTWVVLRYTNVFGPRQVPHGECGVCAVLTDLMLHGKQPTLFGFGEPIRDYVYVGDVARANLLALEKGDNETINVCSGAPTTVNQIFSALKTIIGFDQEPILKPLRPGEVERSLASNEKAARILGWRPTVNLEQGLRVLLETTQG